MSYCQAFRGCTRILAPSANRLAGNVWIVRTASQDSGSDSSTKPKSPKAPPKEPKKDVKRESAPVAELEKGDTYKSGELYYSFNPYSFYDLDRDMEPHRLPQPDAAHKRL
ncbi:hypothetical protein BsWGS_07992 [Bradybaena similaris]